MVVGKFSFSDLLLYHIVNAKELKSIVEDKIASKNLKNISDDKLIIDQRTFINDNGFRRSGDEKAILRRPPKYYTPNERTLNLKILDMMRQSIYDSQYDIQRLDPILEKYKNDTAFRMAFIFNRLQQLIIDIRRVYTLALKWRNKKRVYEQIIWYSHCVRKHIDVLYIVEHLIDKHNEYTKMTEDK
ncbi:unnamed protein product [Euphydryas editha]|uniref:Uncharacterized protein n=1 Tax=Euphydryas editha TaxID=104508 RepID=A0AAU9TY16_EUPED|nr:unnamed protein product [Euphydryas editha]